MQFVDLYEGNFKWKSVRARFSKFWPHLGKMGSISAKSFFFQYYKQGLLGKMPTAHGLWPTPYAHPHPQPNLGQCKKWRNQTKNRFFPKLAQHAGSFVRKFRLRFMMIGRIHFLPIKCESSPIKRIGRIHLLPMCNIHNVSHVTKNLTTQLHH